MWYLTALVCSACFGGWLGHRISKGHKRATVGGMFVGLALVFYSPLNDVTPRPHVAPLVHIAVPADFKHDTIIFLTDPYATAEIAWSGTGEGQIVAPTSGVIRVKSLGLIDNQTSRALLSDGRYNWGLFNSQVGGARFVVYDFNRVSSKPDVGLMSDDEVTTYFREREAQ